MRPGGHIDFCAPSLQRWGRADAPMEDPLGSRPLGGVVRLCRGVRPSSVIRGKFALDRMSHLRQRLTPAMAAIEIGPSYSPVAPKRAGLQTVVVDHATTEGIAAKYAGTGVDLANLEDVDVVWSGGDLAASFPPHRSRGNLRRHHRKLWGRAHAGPGVPLQRCAAPAEASPDSGAGRARQAALLRLLPTADWLSSHEIRARTHSKRTAFNHLAYSVRNGEQIAWGSQKLPHLRLANRLRDAAEHFAAATDAGDGGYTDYHAWRFTPSSFQLIILEMGHPVQHRPAGRRVHSGGRLRILCRSATGPAGDPR